jgi:hypothetical protein
MLVPPFPPGKEGGVGEDLVVELVYVMIEALGAGLLCGGTAVVFVKGPWGIWGLFVGAVPLPVLVPFPVPTGAREPYGVTLGAVAVGRTTMSVPSDAILGVQVDSPALRARPGPSVAILVRAVTVPVAFAVHISVPSEASVADGNPVAMSVPSDARVAPPSAL